MDYITHQGVRLAVAGREVQITCAGDILDLMAAVSGRDCAGMILHEESLPEAFFDLKTRLAGEILQKCSNYRFKLAVIGDFSKYSGKSLRDFIYESNKGRLVFFKNSVDGAAAALAAAQ